MLVLTVQLGSKSPILNIDTTSKESTKFFDLRLEVETLTIL